MEGITKFLGSFRGAWAEQPDGRVSLLVERIGLWFLLTLIALGGYLRFLRIGENSLWLDEVYMLITVRRPFWGGILQLEDYSAPLYQLLLRLITNSPFPSEAIMRLPSALFGCLAIAAAWWFARTLFGSKVALLVATLVAVNSVMIHYSREARPYTLFAVTSTLSMTFFYRLIRGVKGRNGTGYVFFSILLLYSHFYGFLVFSAQVLYVALDRLVQPVQDRSSTPFAAIATICCLSLPSAWLASRYLFSGAKGIMGGWMPSYGPINGIGVFGELVFEQPAMGGLFLIPLIAAVWPRQNGFDFQVCNCRSKPMTEGSSFWQRRAPAILCALWVTVSIYPLIAVSYLYRPVFQPRYALPIVVPLVSLAIAFMRPFGRGIIVLSIGAILIISAPRLYGEIKTGTGIRELAGWLNQNAGVEEKVYTLYAPYCEAFINPGETALHYYGYHGEEPKRLPMALVLRSTKAGAHNDPLPRDERSFIVTLAFRGQVEAFLNSLRRAYQVRAGRMATLFVVEPIKENL
jgi:hypothetical protein